MLGEGADLKRQKREHSLPKGRPFIPEGASVDVRGMNERGFDFVGAPIYPPQSQGGHG